jgi:tRNA-specific 2-thiouridylase
LSEQVIVGMSGGVDSSVAAALLSQQGYRVTGVTLQLYGSRKEAERGCSEARAIAALLGVDHRSVDGRALFEQQVLRPCWESYAAGRTPNPCALCNPAVKLELLSRVAEQLGADWIATGHYARLRRGSDPSSAPVIWRGSDPRKDQSYFLCRLTADQRRRLLLPLGDKRKAQVRELARQLELPCADASESQDACLAQSTEQLAEVLRELFDAEAISGAFVDLQGRPLGRHGGVHRFTIGQRKGLGIALGQRAYVTAIDAARAEVTVSTDKQALLRSELRAEQVRWQLPPPASPFEAEVQVRYRHAAVTAEVVIEGDDADLVAVRFAEPVSAVTPGQAAAFYRGQQLLGGGWISAAFK